MTAQHIAKYQIIAKIGQGAMGEVFRAHDPVLNRDVAVKTISGDMGADETLRKRFQREAQSAGQLNHPNIITVYEFGEHEGKLYMAMELLEGMDLKQAIAQHTLTLEKKLDIMEQIAEGLAFAHATGHRPPGPQAGERPPAARRQGQDHGLRAGALRRVRHDQDRAS